MCAQNTRLKANETVIYSWELKRNEWSVGCGLYFDI